VKWLRLAAASAALMASNGAVAAEARALGSIRLSLPEGCEVKPRQGIDSLVGSISCRRGQTLIHYDIGRHAGNYCENERTLVAPVSTSGVALQLCAREVDAGEGPHERLVLVVPKAQANFFVAARAPGDVMLLLELGQSLKLVTK
jgi:hypothetical protein